MVQPFDVNSIDAAELARGLFEESNDAQFIFCPADLSLIDVNPRAQKLTGRSRKQLLQLNLRDLFDSDNVDRLDELFESCEVTRLFHSREAYRLTRTTGDSLEVNVTASRLHTKPDVIGLLSVRDVSERKVLESELRQAKSQLQAALMDQSESLQAATADLRESERRIRELMDDLDAIVWEIEPETCQFTFVSQQAVSILGFEISQWLTETDFWINHMHPDDREKTVGLCDEAIRNRRDHEFDYRMIAADGRIVWLHDVVRVCNGENGTPTTIRGVMFDITARKHAEQQLRSIVAHLNVAEERERRRISRILHDQLAPSIAACQMRLNVIQSALSDPGLQDAVENIWTQLADCTEQARFLAVETSPPILYELGLAPAIEWLTERYAQQHGLEIRYVVKTTTAVFEPARATLFQAARELLINVVRHSRAKTVDVTIDRQGDFLVIRVRDDGVGFDPEDTRLETLKSQGFGLFGMRDRFQLFGGHIEVESQPGFGTCVQLYAPLKSIETTATASTVD